MIPALEPEIPRGLGCFKGRRKGVTQGDSLTGESRIYGKGGTMADNGYVLCMYDIRGKQEFIYRSSKLKEIVGGSLIIRDLFKDYLYKAAKKYRNRIKDLGNQKAIKAYEPNAEELEQFSFSEFERRMQGEQYIGEIVYDGGGNFLLLYKDEEAMKKTTEIFTKKILEKIGTLRVVATHITGISPERYHSEDANNPGDYERLYQQHRVRESTALYGVPYGSLPIVQTNPSSGQPLTYMYDNAPKDSSASEKSYVKYSTETRAKLKKYWEEAEKHGEEMGEKILDNIVAETKGEDSMLAIFYIDGNAMGAKVQACLQGKKTYDDCVNKLREFSREVQKTFVDDRKKDLRKVDEAQTQEKEKENRSRILIGAGDEMTIICKAGRSYEIIKEYLSNLPSSYSSCAGAAIFHSHAPFADAYRIAEQCCEDSCKKYMKDHGLTLANLMDFEYCQGGIGLDLKEIRKENGDFINSRPWLVERADEVEGRTAEVEEAWEKENSAKITELKQEGLLSLKDVEAFFQNLTLLGRSNIKGLAVPASLSDTALKTELRRIIAHMSETAKKGLVGSSDEDRLEYFLKNKGLLKDLVRMYDVGYGKGENQGGENGK